MSIYDKIATRIIKEQELLMGSVAWFEASKVRGLKVFDQKIGVIIIEESVDGRVVIDDLVGKYTGLFGRAAKEVCKEAATALIADLPVSDVPLSLQ